MPKISRLDKTANKKKHFDTFIGLKDKQNLSTDEMSLYIAMLYLLFSIELPVNVTVLSQCTKETVK